MVCEQNYVSKHLVFLATEEEENVRGGSKKVFSHEIQFKSSSNERTKTFDSLFYSIFFSSIPSKEESKEMIVFFLLLFLIFHCV
ncbi:Uncharacterized protein TCM_000862 [Theobroma cacao]|uniref:Uncharacterized protein n=1 Tax=Theobroma cacao TaxID=3641 RepID=A0A061DH65_THECC|nr:Uncharacterized protein TCM_000862 [Theobroma cacao]